MSGGLNLAIGLDRARGVIYSNYWMVNNILFVLVTPIMVISSSIA